MDTTVGVFLPALRDALQARAGLAGIPVWTADPDASQAPFSEALIFGVGETKGGKASVIEVTGDWRAIGRRSRQESYTVPGEVLAIAYGSGEDVIALARDRALSLMGEVNECLWADPTVGGIVRTAHITDFRLYQGVAGEQGNGRGAYIQFEISVEAQLTRGA